MGGENISWKKLLTTVFIIIIFFTIIASISASNIDDDALNQTDLNMDVISSQDDEIPDVPDLIEDVTNNVTPTNIGVYFQNGVLNEKHAGETLIFSGNFENYNQLTIRSDNVKIIGNNAEFKNTFFKIESNNVVLKNLSFDANKAIKNNDWAVISVSGSNIDLIDLNIKYIVPNDVEAYAILADGYNNDAADCLKIINSTIYFEGHNFNTNRYNCAIKLTCADSLIMDNNTITTSLPLKNVNYGINGASLDSSFVYTIGLEECNNFIINNNTIICDVNKRTAVTYPTLDCVIISKSDNGLFTNNSIYMTDFVTYPGIENYIYGVDILKLNDLLVADNKISIITTGGKMAMGTAYPIQISGPISGINITRNDLYSFSNGPNIGIYSQNYYGPTYLSITFNKINVTGLAGSHEWALVTGIESQDTNAEILNNYIEVHSIAPVSIDDNLYAISYRQSTAGEHTFDIENNFAVSNGYYAVYLLSSQYSTITNNTLISSNDNVNTGDDSYKKGSKDHNNDIARENMVITVSDYYKSNNHIIVSQNSNSNDNNRINGKIFSWNNYDKQQNPTSNPLAPHYTNINKASSNIPADSKESDDGKYIDDGSVQGSINNHDDANTQTEHSTNDKEAQYSFIYSQTFGNVDIDGFKNGVISNSSDISPSENGNGNPLSKSQSVNSPDSSKSVSKKVYELDEIIKDNEKFIPSVFLIIIILSLLIVGYKRKYSNFEK